MPTGARWQLPWMRQTLMELWSTIKCLAFWKGALYVHCITLYEYIQCIPLSICPLLLYTAFQEKTEISTFKMLLAHFFFFTSTFWLFFLAYWPQGSYRGPIHSMMVKFPFLCLSLTGKWPVKEKSLLPGTRKERDWWWPGPALMDRNSSWGGDGGGWVQWQLERPFLS